MVAFHGPAFAASKLEACVLVCGMLVLESNLLCFRSLTDGSTQLDLALVDPSLVGRRIFDITRRLHLMVQLQLFHESFIGLNNGSGLP